MSAVISLGRIESVDLRTAWPNEERNFTPWLAEEENLALLGSALGIQLELESVEKKVGPFSADILAKEIATDRWVLIENQIETTDHCHLGQLLTYASGLDVSTVVWIARDFREQHRAAIDYLNRITDDEHHFFGVEVELLKIGESAYAPSFTLIAKPNDWSKKGAVAKFSVEDALTPTQALYREFWSSVIEAAKGEFPSLAGRKASKASWQAGERIGSGPGFSLDANAAFTKEKRLRVEVYISGASSASAFERLLQRRLEIEDRFGSELEWDRARGHEARIAFYMDGQHKIDIKTAWDEERRWLLEYWKVLSDSFKPELSYLREELSADAGE